jgi:hypothetical protein
MAKATKKQFTKIITTSKNWPHALRRLHEHYGYSLKSDKAMRVRAKKLGIKPGLQHDMEIPDGYDIKGISVLSRGQEELLRWTKTSKSKQEEAQLIKEFALGLIDGATIVPRVPAPLLPIMTDYLTEYIEPEPHYGMHSWAKETRENYDIKLAKQYLQQAATRLIAAAPPTKYALVTGLGDGLHADNQTEQTTSGNKLDTDTRWGKIIRSYAEFYRWWINELLKKHEIVHVVRVKGNHDDHSTTAINLMLGYVFEDNPRVIIDQDEFTVKYHMFGKNIIGITHGDKSKGDNLPLLMANDEPIAWGECPFRYFHTGHIHHLSKKEYIGVVVESFRSIAAKDAWHAASGYRAGRDMQMIVFHKDFGESERHVVNIAQLEVDED